VAFVKKCLLKEGGAVRSSDSKKEKGLVVTDMAKRHVGTRSPLTKGERARKNLSQVVTLQKGGPARTI
jgi:hypothetical protein